MEIAATTQAPRNIEMIQIFPLHVPGYAQVVTIYCGWNCNQSVTD